MTNQRKGDWIQTYMGIQFWPLDPRPEEISIVDVAHALSLQCRFGGHCREFYSVAEHSVRVSRIIQPLYRLWGLLHDAAEAYLVDLPRPLKRSSIMGGIYQAIEADLAHCIREKFVIDSHWAAWIEISEADNTLLMTEKRDLLTVEPAQWTDTGVPLPEIIKPWDSLTAEVNFLHCYNEYRKG